MIDEYKEIHSTVPSQMKRQSKWVVTADETLKGKKHTMVTIRHAFEDEDNKKMTWLVYEIDLEIVGPGVHLRVRKD